MGACLCMQFRGSLAAVWAKARIAIEGEETSVLFDYSRESDFFVAAGMSNALSWPILAARSRSSMQGLLGFCGQWENE